MWRTLILIILGSGCVFVLFLFWHVYSSSAPASSQIADTQNLASEKHPQHHPQLPQQVDLDAFYQTIIDNNIFRPLNWEPPQREPAYTLIGTAVATAGNTATAYIQERKSDRFYTKLTGFVVRGPRASQY